ncbi:MAG: hypothetical protein IH589_04755 [Anaerolineales bacterium]|nr:hypothetical protein [Anaerolineales bacterium]
MQSHLPAKPVMKLLRTDPIKRVFNGNTFQLAGIALICLGLVYILLSTPPRADLTAQYYEMGFEKIIFLLAVFTLMMRLRGAWGNAIGLTAVVSLFLLSLIYKWQTADNFLLLGGLFPQRDALDYYTDAQRLMHGFDMAGPGVYRPIYSSFLAVLMKAAGSNLQLTLIFLTIGNALAAYLAALEIRRVLKSNAAAAFYIILAYMFFRRFSGTLLTENLGFCLGSLALTFLIRGAFQNRFSQLLYGVFLLTIALNARAGAFLVLPVLAIWLGVSFREARGFWRPFLSGSLVILLGMTANYFIARVTTSPGAKMFSNYSYTLYGLAAGNKGWEQAGLDYPNADTNQIYSLALQKIINDPSLFVGGVFGAYRDYFESSKGAFSFLILEHDRGDVANLALWLLTWIGLIGAIVRRKEKSYSIVLAFFLGIFISVSLVPPADSQRMRALAATIPLTGFILAAGIASIHSLLQKNKTAAAMLEETEPDWTFIMSASLLTVCLVLPVFVKWIGKPLLPDPSIGCRANEKVLTLSIAEGSSIKLGSAVNQSYVPNIEVSLFEKKNIRPEQQMQEEDKPFFHDLPAGTILTLAWGAEADGSLPAAVSLVTTDLPKTGTYTLCLTPTPVDDFYFAHLNQTQIAAFPISVSERFGLNGVFRAIQIFVLAAVFLFLLVDFYRLPNLPRKKLLAGAANALMAGAGILFFLHHFGILPLVTEQRLIDVKQVRHPGDFNLYAVNLGTDKISDTEFIDFPARLYEDGVLLGPQHESQSLIDIYGGGGHILKGNFLYFSTSDNSDPRANGREYTLAWPTRFRLRYQVIALAALFLSLVIHRQLFKPDASK